MTQLRQGYDGQGAAEHKAVLFRFPVCTGTGLVARFAGSELSFA